MKKNALKNLLTLFAGAVICTSCTKTKSENYTSTYSLGVNEEKMIQGNNGKIIFTVKSINDNRCLDEENCPSEGYAEVGVEIKEPQLPAKAISLCLGDCTGMGINEESNFELNGYRYTLLLKDVILASDTPQSDESKVAVIDISKTY